MAELRSENLSKSTENHRLRRSIKKVTQELSNLQQERERLERALEAAQSQRSWVLWARAAAWQWPV